jgi:hypothetical protein
MTCSKLVTICKPLILHLYSDSPTTFTTVGVTGSIPVAPTIDVQKSAISVAPLSNRDQNGVAPNASSYRHLPASPLIFAGINVEQSDTAGHRSCGSSGEEPCLRPPERQPLLQCLQALLVLQPGSLPFLLQDCCRHGRCHVGRDETLWDAIGSDALVPFRRDRLHEADQPGLRGCIVYSVQDCPSPDRDEMLMIRGRARGASTSERLRSHRHHGRR